MRKIALVLLGCGHRDGSEITESVSAILALTELKAQISYFSFDENFPVIDEPNQKRNALIESQRISRGSSQNITDLNVNDYDALVIPGGSGLLTHLTTWSTDHFKFKVHAQLTRVVEEFHEQSKPIGAICIAPFLVAQILRKHEPLITLGESSDLIPALKKMGIEHELCPSTDFITDRVCKIVSTPAYMNTNPSPFEVSSGIKLMIKELVEMS